MAFLTPAATKGGRTNRQRAIRATQQVTPVLQQATLLTAWSEADDKTMREGMGWYLNAHRISAELADENNLTPTQTAGILAATSQNTAWGDNITIARRVCGGELRGHTNDVMAKCEAMLEGKSPNEVLGGRKVRSFYTNIRHPERSGAVTVDRHMIDLLVGLRGTQKGLLERVGVYQYAAASIRGAAREVGVKPHELQAVTWLQHRHRHEVAFRKYDPPVVVS